MDSQYVGAKWSCRSCYREELQDAGSEKGLDLSFIGFSEVYSRAKVSIGPIFQASSSPIVTCWLSLLN